LGAVVAIAVLGAIVNSALNGGLQRRLVEQKVPAPLRAYIDKTVREGGLPSTASVNDYPPALRPLVRKILDIVYTAFGDGLHTCFTLATALLVVGAVVAAVAVRHGSSPADDETGSVGRVGSADTAETPDGTGNVDTGYVEAGSGGGLPSPTTPRTTNH
jgi:hypothetical protein